MDRKLSNKNCERSSPKIWEELHREKTSVSKSTGASQKGLHSTSSSVRPKQEGNGAASRGQAVPMQRTMAFAFQTNTEQPDEEEEFDILRPRVRSKEKFNWREEDAVGQLGGVDSNTLMCFGARPKTHQPKDTPVSMKVDSGSTRKLGDITRERMLSRRRQQQSVQLPERDVPNDPFDLRSFRRPLSEVLKTTPSDRREAKFAFTEINKFSASRGSSVNQEKTEQSKRRPGTVNAALTPPCLYCKGQHAFKDCPAVFKFPCQQLKLDLLKKYDLCFSCLDKGHLSRDCTDKIICPICSWEHPYIMHKQSLSEMIKNGQLDFLKRFR